MVPNICKLYMIRMQHNYWNNGKLYIKMQHNYCNICKLYIRMQHNYFNICIQYFANLISELSIIIAIIANYIRMQHNYIDMRLRFEILVQFRSLRYWGGAKCKDGQSWRFWKEGKCCMRQDLKTIAGLPRLLPSLTSKLLHKLWDLWWKLIIKYSISTCLYAIYIAN